MKLYTHFALFFLISPVFSGEIFEPENGTYALKSYSSSGFLDGRNRGEPQMTSIKGDFAEWLIEAYRGAFTIKNKQTSEYLCADNKSDHDEIRPKLVTSRSEGTKWRFVKRGNDIIIKNINIDGYLDGRHTFDIVYPRILASESHNYTKWSLKRIHQSSNPVKIPNKDLDNGEKWHNWCLDQTGGTCTSHAVTAVLTYIHGIDGIMPNYIHKYTHFHHGRDTRYENNGLSINEAMEFVNDFGVPRVPEGMQVEYNSGNPFPKRTTKYTFEGIANVMEASWLTTSGMVDRIKEVIRKYKLPVVVSLTSRKGTEVKMNCNLHPTSLAVSDDRVRIRNRHIPCTVLSAWPKVDEKIGHALCFWGYDDIKEAFYIKNSWGEDDWAGRYSLPLSGGNALLAYKYVELWGRNAYVGWGAKIISKNLDYEAKRIQERPNAGGGGGSAFNFSVSSQITSISIRSGWYVDALSISYSNGQTYSYGGNGGSEHKITLGKSEFLTGIKGRAGKYIDNISFITNKRTYGPYGGDGGAAYSFLAPEGYVIDGFYGRSGKFIDAISVSLAINGFVA